ncbi:hypothetical protein [Chromobacterium vaccinii]|uniref:hypothetical protein n=1 Tax=Chromobacterium vaccinii TaxID=1108595 RepID=UPI000E1885F9|nr:hypothetical protein [Chromobacterium vaccinii]SUX56225.1 Uncharacterised protein [Chromobacterium vaccinii]
MSYIDSIKHEFVGYLNGLPIYHPLEESHKANWGASDFSCGKSNLVLGGGSGEHPGLVIHNLPALVCEYLLYEISQCELLFPDRYKAPAEEAQNKLLDIALSGPPTLEFCGWSMQDYKKFIESAMSEVHRHPLKQDGDAEAWIKHSIGEFVYFSLATLNPLHDDIQKIIDEYFHWNVGYFMCNVTCPPPGYFKGKKEALKSSTHPEYGFFRWDYIHYSEDLDS